MKKTLLYLLFIFGSVATINAQTVVTFYTTLGDFEVKLYDAERPITAGNFLDLVNQEFYDGVIFHRVISDFMIQSGDPTGTGSGGPGYSIPDEFQPPISNLKKTISMANTGQPNSGGSQFFINLKNNTYLDFDKPPYTSAHPVFGEVITGWEVVELIADVPVNSNNRPLTPVVINMIRITQPLAINEFATEDTSFTIYPNPVTAESVVELTSKSTEMTVFSIMDVNGLVVNSQNIQVRKGINKINLSNFGINKLPVGMYFISISNGNGITHKRFLVSK